jgi:N-carbamoylputrescine amidase
MRVGVCELHPELEPESEEWKSLCREVSNAGPEIFLLNELPFGPWISAGETCDPAVVKRSQLIHEAGLAHLDELGATFVLGTRPVNSNGRNVNQAFLWMSESGLIGVHSKQYFPEESGYYEARWFQAGKCHFRVVQAREVRIGFLICTEVMFNEHARRYGREGAHILVVPRAVGSETLPRWLVAVKMAAIVSGCYVLSSNRGGVDSKGQQFGGRGWLVDPDGELIAETSPERPVVFGDVDVERVEQAQREYPCYVSELTRDSFAY